jgi:hypothetical protein
MSDELTRLIRARSGQSYGQRMAGAPQSDMVQDVRQGGIPSFGVPLPAQPIPELQMLMPPARPPSLPRGEVMRPSPAWARPGKVMP